MSLETGNSEIKDLILENQRLLSENNDLLKKLHRSAVRHFWFNIAWIVIFFGLPLIAFYKLAMPLYGTMQTSKGGLEVQLKDLNEMRAFLEEQR